jgi:hypothetical protein
LDVKESLVKFLISVSHNEILHRTSHGIYSKENSGKQNDVSGIPHTSSDRYALAEAVLRDGCLGVGTKVIPVLFVTRSASTRFQKHGKNLDSVIV